MDPSAGEASVYFCGPDMAKITAALNEKARKLQRQVSTIFRRFVRPIRTAGEAEAACWEVNILRRFAEVGSGFELGRIRRWQWPSTFLSST